MSSARRHKTKAKKGPKPLQSGGSVAAKPVEIAPPPLLPPIAPEDAVWEIGTATFEADAECPLMPVWPWGGHRNWAYDLVRFIRPPVIAELGVHWGTSLFAFAQAVKDANLASRMIGVDTWRGDNHTGPYGTEVLGTVQKIADTWFPRQKFDFHPMTFDEALPLVADESVDLMHIDGFHTYEAVEHDFETWLPKLAPEGIILLHDVDQSTGYGSAKFWNDLLKKHPGFAFTHSWGLGVVFPKGDRWLRALERNGIADKISLYTYRAQFERSQIELRDTGKMAVERLDAMESMGSMIRDRDSEITFLKSMVSERDASIAQRGAELDSLRVHAGEVSSQLAHHKSRLEATEAVVAELRPIADRVPGLETTITELITRAEGAETSLASTQSELAATIVRVGELESLLASTAATLAQSRSEVATLQATIASLNVAIDILRARLRESEQTQITMSADMQAMFVRITSQTRETDELRTLLARSSAMNEATKDQLQQLSADVEMLALRVEQLERLEIERERKGEKPAAKRAAAKQVVSSARKPAR
jgi:hypothetical protein